MVFQNNLQNLVSRIRVVIPPEHYYLVIEITRLN